MKREDYNLSRPPIARFQVIWACMVSGTFSNASDLARALEVSTKSIHRDIEFMRDRLGFPIDYDSQRWGYRSGIGPVQCPFCGSPEQIVSRVDISFKPVPSFIPNLPRAGIEFNGYEDNEREVKLANARAQGASRSAAAWRQHDRESGTEINRHRKVERNIYFAHGKFKVVITRRGRGNVYVGRFTDLDAAIAARDVKESEFPGQKAGRKASGAGRTQAILRAERLAKGLCQCCGDEPKRPGKKSCKSCIDFATAKRREKRLAVFQREDGSARRSDVISGSIR